MKDDDIAALEEMAAHFMAKDPNEPLGNILRLTSDEIRASHTEVSRLRAALQEIFDLCIIDGALDAPVNNDSAILGRITAIARRTIEQ